MTYAFIERQRNVWPISAQCRVLDVSVSGYGQYRARQKRAAWTGAAPAKSATTRLSDMALLVHIRALFVEMKGAYGWPRIWRELAARSVRGGKERVRRLMQANGLHGPRQDRRWAWAWSPEQIARRLVIDFPNDEAMRICHEAIYQALYVQGRGSLRRELTVCLRTGRTLRMPRRRTALRGKNFVSNDIMISQRPAEANDRAVPGHWEGDLILGLNSSALGTLVERSTRFTMLLPLPRMEGHCAGPSVKNGSALTGHGADAVRDAITRTITTLPEELRRSLTWDQGAEMAQHARLKVDAGVQVYFCNPQSPWQRGTNEHTNGLLRQYFPKGTDLCAHHPEALAAVAAALNSRPRKTLGRKTPAEALDQWLAQIEKQRVATIG